MDSPTTVHLDDANTDVALALSYGDMLAIEDAGNAAIQFDPETSERKIDGSYITARRNAMLSVIPKGISLDAIKQLSPKDGKRLEEAVAALYSAANAANDPESPKGETSKKR
jgi:hypothetical protein